MECSDIKPRKINTLGIGFVLAVVAPQLAAAQDVIVVPEASVAAITQACAGSDQAACAAAIQAVVATLSATYPAANLETLLGSVTAELAAQGNNAIATAQPALATAIANATAAVVSVAQNSGTSATFVASVTSVANAVAAGEQVDIQGFADATGRDIEELQPSTRVGSPA